MTNSPRRDVSPLRLYRAGPNDDGTHSSPALSRGVKSGRLFRLQQGIYVDAERWLKATPWDRYIIAVTAHAHRRPDEVLTLQTALVIHGVDLLNVPQRIFLRCLSPGMVGSSSMAAPDGRTASSASTGLRSSAGKVRSLEIKRLEPALPKGISRTDHRHLVAQGAVTLPTQRLNQPLAPWLSPPENGYLVETLPFTLVTAVPTMSFAEAVVALDSARSGRHTQPEVIAEDDVGQYRNFLRTTRAQGHFDRAWDFSDSRSESVGESWSRALFAGLGFAPPELQQVFELPNGRKARVDFWWPEVGVVGEFDGLVKYRTPQAAGGHSAEDTVIQEKLREDALRQLAVTVVRWTWADLIQPARLRRLLERAGVPRVS